MIDKRGNVGAWCSDGSWAWITGYCAEYPYIWRWRYLLKCSGFNTLRWNNYVPFHEGGTDIAPPNVLCAYNWSPSIVWRRKIDGIFHYNQKFKYPPILYTNYTLYLVRWCVHHDVINCLKQSSFTLTQKHTQTCTTLLCCNCMLAACLVIDGRTVN